MGGNFGSGSQYRAVPSCHMLLLCVANSVAQYHTPGWLLYWHKATTGVPSSGSLSLTLIQLPMLSPQPVTDLPLSWA